MGIGGRTCIPGDMGCASSQSLVTSGLSVPAWVVLATSPF